MNVHLQKYYQGLVSVADPLDYDTRLHPGRHRWWPAVPELDSSGTSFAADGEKQARRACREVAPRMHPRPDVIVVSPLTRCLQTCRLVFEGQEDIPRVVTPLASERVWHSSDVGRSPRELEIEFPVS